MTLKTKHFITRRQFVISASALLASCGGGDGGIEVGSGGTGNNPPTTPVPVALQDISVSGPITGFGSIIINGLKFDDTNANVTDELGRSVNKDFLRLGMTVSVTGKLQSDGVTAIAANVQLRSEVKGTISAIDLANQKITVLGITVMATVNTSFDDVANLAALRVGDVVQVFGLRDPQTQLITATRIERSSTIEFSSFIVSNVRSIDSINKIITLGSVERSVLVNVASAVVSPAGSTIAIGQKLFVEIDSANATPLRAQRITVLLDSNVFSTGRAEIEGVVSDYQSLTSFKLAGQVINASLAKFDQGSPSDVKNGALASVKGTLENGVLVAIRIEVQAAGNSGSGGTGSGSDPYKFELNGTVWAFTSLSNFVVRNTVVDASSAIFSEGSAALLGVNAKVDMQGIVKGDKFIALVIKVKR
jgi:hypothetical protein